MTEFSPGLEGIVAARTAIGHVDGENGRLIYRGYSIGDLASAMTYEEVAHLLWFGELPTRGQLAELVERMGRHRGLGAPARATLDAMPVDTDPMDVLRTVLSAQGASPRLQKPDVDQAIRLTACLPTILAGFDRRRKGLPVVPPAPGGDHATSYLRMLTGEEPPPEKVASLNTYMVLLADHGMNASTFTAQLNATTNTDLYSAVVGAVGALKGPAHGGAPALVLDMLRQIGRPENAESWMRDALARKERLMGFGHRVYRTYDPRAEILREMTRQADPEFFELARTAEEVGLRLLRERQPDRRLYTNVEFYSAGVLHAVGLPQDMFPPTFAVARAAGWTAHVLELLQEPRLIRPASEYVGPALRRPVPLGEREPAPRG